MIIWIASYPKSGNTWVRSFLSNYLSDQSTFNFDLLSKISKFPNKKIIQELNVDTSDFMNVAANWIPMQELINLKNDFTYLKTHNAMTTIGKHKFTNSANTCGFIYLVRDPRDVILSYASHLGENLNETFKTMVHDYTFENSDLINNHKNVILGSWGNNYKSWKNCNFSKGLILRYEDLVLEPIKSFTKIIKFLNELNKLEINEEKIVLCYENTKFDNLKKLEDEFTFKESGKNKFFRKGEVGDWKDNLCPKMCSQIETFFKLEMEELNYL
jgi:hypothetical protein